MKKGISRIGVEMCLDVGISCRSCQLLTPEGESREDDEYGYCEHTLNTLYGLVLKTFNKPT